MSIQGNVNLDRPLLKAIVGTAVGLAALYLALYLFVGQGQIIGDTPWYVPTVYGFVGLSSFLVAFVAGGRYTVVRAPETYWIGTAFAAFGLQSILFVLSWPGLGPDGSSILGRVPATSAWIGVIEVATLGGFLLAATVSRWPAPGALSPRTERASVFAALALTTLPCVLVILLDRRLPSLIDARHQFSVGNLVLNIALATLFAVGALLSVRRYRQTGDALKAYVALTQIAWTFVLVGHVMGGKRYDVWYYLGRMLQAGAALTMLFGLLADYVGLLRRERARSVELQEAQRRLEEADAKKNRYLSMLSHELRNPLAAIASAVSVAAARVGVDSVLEHATEIAGRQIGYMTRMLDDLLDVARITHGRLALRTETIDVATAVQHAVETVRPKIEARRHHLTVSLPDEPVLVEADPVRLSQVISNVLDNAVKYTPPGGAIAVAATRDDDDVVIRVRDTGQGISPDLLPHVFEPFERGELSTGTAEGGLGVGLALVRRLVELHHGAVEASSAGPGEGTEIIVRLPVRAASEITARARSASGIARAVRRRILIVDDNVDSAEMLKMYLELAGHEVATAFDGVEALRLAPEYRPDLVFLDLGMPGMDGFEIAARLQQLPVLAQTRIVAVTGYGDEHHRERSRAHGFADYLVKPVAIEALRRVVETVLPGASAR